MSVNEFKQEVYFGLENLTRIRAQVLYISEQDVDRVIRMVGSYIRMLWILQRSGASHPPIY